MKLSDSNIKMCSIILSILVLLPLGIVTVNFGNREPTCEPDNINLISISTYLLGVGASQLILSFLLGLLSFRNSTVSYAPHCVMFIMLLTFDIIWFFIGGISLIRDNLFCITPDNTIFIFAISIWCISFFQICFLISSIIYIVKQPMCGLPPQYLSI